MYPSQYKKFRKCSNIIYALTLFILEWYVPKQKVSSNRSLLFEIGRIILGLSVIGFSFVMIVLIGFFLYFQPNNICYHTLFPRQHHIEQLAKIDFPTSITDLSYNLDFSGEFTENDSCTVSLQFSFLPEDLDQLLDSSLIDDFDASQTDDSDHSWFNWEMNNNNWHWSSEEGLFFVQDVNDCPDIKQGIYINQDNDDVYIASIITNEYRDYFTGCY